MRYLGILLTTVLLFAGSAFGDQGSAKADTSPAYAHPNRIYIDSLMQRLLMAKDGGSLAEFTALEGETRRAYEAIRLHPDFKQQASWLRDQLELVDAAQALSRPLPTLPTKEVRPRIPSYDYWFAKMRLNPPPQIAEALMPQLRRSFVIEQAPVELVWLAEVESTFNPRALSRSGARGLYQLMPDTARILGLSTWSPDERTHPEKCARAAARYLRFLYKSFGDWPLALAAYNAGEGRVRRSLAKRGTGAGYADIAHTLPVETRLYVPKALALVAIRTGVGPEALGRQTP